MTDWVALGYPIESIVYQTMYRIPNDKIFLIALKDSPGWIVSMVEKSPL